MDETLMEFDDIEKIANKTGENISPADRNHPYGHQHYRAGALGYSPLCVDETSPMQKMLNQSSMFLFPCIIEYTLICAGVVFIMWEVVGSSHNSKINQRISGKHPKIFSVDCTHAANGLFAGIMVMVLTIIGLIVFFLFVDNGPVQSSFASLTGDILDIALNTFGLIAVIYCGIVFSKKLQIIHIHTANMALDDGLLIVTMV